MQSGWDKIIRTYAHSPTHVNGCEMPKLLAWILGYTVFGWLDTGHPCYGRFTAVKKGYRLTSTTWLYHGLRFTVRWRDAFFKLSADQLLVFNWGSLFSKRNAVISCVQSRITSLKISLKLRFWPWLNLYIIMRIDLISGKRKRLRQYRECSPTAQATRFKSRKRRHTLGFN